MMDIKAATGVGAPGLEGVDAISLEVFEQWGRTLHLQRQLALKILPEKSLHPAQARCLWTISANDGISQRDLAGMLHLSKPTVTTMLQRLEKAGLVERHTDADDQRLMRILLTEEGRKLGARMCEFHRELIKATVGSLATDDQREFGRLLGLLRANMETALGCGGPEEGDCP
jgi:MarR family transcriptional regulator, organic hydroperoxide resistance regulator